MSAFGFDPNANSFQPVPDPFPYGENGGPVKSCALGRVFADRSSTIVFFYENEDETLAVFGFTTEEATKIGNAFISSVRAAEAQRDKLTGRTAWVRQDLGAAFGYSQGSTMPSVPQNYPLWCKSLRGIRGRSRLGNKIPGRSAVRSMRRQSEVA